MTLDTRTIVLVTGRLMDLASLPRLFDDRMPPARIVRRLDRVLSWLGSSGRIIASEHIKRRSVPPPGKRQWARGGHI
ncbi:MAG: hypothetical protein AB7K67_01000 [Hyphomicrobiaceae bacterium]